MSHPEKSAISVLREALESLYEMTSRYAISDTDYGTVCNAAAALKATESAAIQPAGEEGNYPYDALFQAIGDSLDSTVKIAGTVFSISVKAFVESIRAKGFNIIATAPTTQPTADVSAPSDERKSLESSELYRMQMAAICCAAIGYDGDKEAMSPEYITPALRDVQSLYAKYVAARAAAPVGQPTNSTEGK